LDLVAGQIPFISSELPAPFKALKGGKTSDENEALDIILLYPATHLNGRDVAFSRAINTMKVNT